MQIADRPCFYNNQAICDDCNGQHAECRRLIAADQADENE